MFYHFVLFACSSLPRYLDARLLQRSCASPRILHLSSTSCLGCECVERGDTASREARRRVFLYEKVSRVWKSPPLNAVGRAPTHLANSRYTQRHAFPALLSSIDPSHEAPETCQTHPGTATPSTSASTASPWSTGPSPPSPATSHSLPAQEAGTEILLLSFLNIIPFPSPPFFYSVSLPAFPISVATSPLVLLLGHLLKVNEPRAYTFTQAIHSHGSCTTDDSDSDPSERRRFRFLTHASPTEFSRKCRATIH